MGNQVDANFKRLDHIHSDLEGAITSIISNSNANTTSIINNNNANTGHTHTDALDEPTVDDQHAPVLSAITPLRADQNARLAITAGNDTGQTFEIRPGKTYTIGRAIDNDVVLSRFSALELPRSERGFSLRCCISLALAHDCSLSEGFNCYS